MKKINTNGGAYINGSINTGGGKFVGRDDNSVIVNERSIDDGFSALASQVDKFTRISQQDKVDIKEELNEIKLELLKGSNADEDFIQRRLRNIYRMSTDILEVILASMVNPVLGLGLVAKKVAEKVKAELS